MPSQVVLALIQTAIVAVVLALVLSGTLNV